MADLYSIKEQTLIDIGDALRRRHGETEMGIVLEDQLVPKVEVFKSNNATGFKQANDEAIEVDSTNHHEQLKVISIPEATTIKVKCWVTDSVIEDEFYIFDDRRETVNIYTDQADSMTPSTTEIIQANYIFEVTANSNVVTLYTHFNPNKSGQNAYYVECTGLDAQGNPVETVIGKVEVEKEVKRTYKSSEMAAAIDAIEAGAELPEEAFVLSGNCLYRFYGGGWDWFVDMYGDKITTKNIFSTAYMFQLTRLKHIPFELNFSGDSNALTNIFNTAEYLESVPKINNCQPDGTKNMFSNCRRLRYIPDDIVDWFDWSKAENTTTAYQIDRSYMFTGCHSLRAIPTTFLAPRNPKAAYSYVYFYNGFSQCFALDELIDLPLRFTETYTNNIFSSTFNSCHRLQNVTFAMTNGQPCVMNWKSQVIDLSSYTGYALSKTNILSFNSGITADKEVTDDATYQALKNDPDWFSMKVEYSRYNHDSAVATINSLPDTSAYLASAGGTNTIKFQGRSGSATDGGAISTLTEAEIAVATAKGWTVTLL